MPRISVVLSVRNGDRYLEAALRSVLEQSFTDFEVIAIDDGSSDSSAEILDRASRIDGRVRIISHYESIGLTRSLNEALGVARGELIARQDADDLSDPTRFERQVRCFDSQPDLLLLGTSCRVVDADTRERARVRAVCGNTALRWRILFSNSFCHTSMMFRAALPDGSRVLYDPSLAVAQDYALWARLMEFGRAENLRSPLVSLRVHDESISARRADEQRRTATAVSVQALQRACPQLKWTPFEAMACRRWLGLGDDDGELAPEILDVVITLLETVTRPGGWCGESPKRLRADVVHTLLTRGRAADASSVVGAGLARLRRRYPWAARLHSWRRPMHLIRARLGRIRGRIEPTGVPN